MKNFTFGFLLIFLFGGKVFGQTVELKKLTAKKETLQNQINSLNDSIKILDRKISVENGKISLADTKFSKFDGILINGGKIKDSPSPFGNEIEIVKEETKVAILDYINDYFKICVSDKCGFTNSMWIKSTPEIKKFIENTKLIDNEIRLQNAKKIAEKSKHLNDNYQKSLIKKFGIKTYNSLIDGQYWLGMTSEMALISFGKPNEIN